MAIIVETVFGMKQALYVGLAYAIGTPGRSTFATSL